MTPKQVALVQNSFAKDAGQIVGTFAAPEPSSLAIISVGLMGLGFLSYRKRV
jgi:putative exporter of polyketide antibiotics